MAAAACVQYGCGLSAPQGWLNFDASPTLRLQRLPLVGRLGAAGGTTFPGNVRYGDIVKGLPIEARSCRAVYCSHVLEHLSLGDFRVALANTRAVLAPGGIFRLVVPDLRVAAQRYVADSSDTAAERFMTETFLGLTERPKGVRGLVRSWLGNSQHLWMWDYPSLRRELETAGFNDIREARMGDSGDPMFATVEEESRWVDAVGAQCAA
jgi:SAM-dependent methyltransferase